ncbi:phage tail protein [Enterobacter kobei]|nr:phage tail protein [Enterobacter kobei]
MGLSFFQRLNDWLTFTMSAMVTSIGVMTLSEKIALAGLLVGMVFGARGWLYRARIERGQKRRNELINQILERAEHRQMRESERRALDLLQQNEPEDETAY